MDRLVAITRLQPACDIRAAVSATITCGQSADRWIHGCWSIAGVDRCCAHRRVALRRMAWAVDRRGTNRHGCGSARAWFADGARACWSPAAADLFDRHWYRCLLGFYRSTHHDWREAWRGEHRCRGRHTSSVLRAAFWVPMAFVAAPLAASMIGLRLVTLTLGRVPTIAAN